MSTSPPPTNQHREFPPEPLTTDEVHALLRAASTRSTSGIRLRALIGVMYGAGLRVGEALALYPRDVDTQAGTVRVRLGSLALVNGSLVSKPPKGGKTRTVGIDPASSAHIDRWLDRRRSLGLNGTHPLFATYEQGTQRYNVGQPLDPRYVRQALARLAKRAGIDKRVHPHGMRHSLAYRLARTGKPMVDIQRQLGHANVATTNTYVNHLMPADLVGMMRAETW